MQRLGLSDEEKKVIRDAEALSFMRTTAGWKKIREIMGMYVTDALNDLEGAHLSSDDRVRSNLLLRYTLRKDFVQMVDNYLGKVEEIKKETLRDIAQASGYNPIEAYDFARGEETNG